MAFSNVRKIPLGGSVSVMVGNFTHTEGAADQTLGIAGDVLFFAVSPLATAEPVDHCQNLFSLSLSGQINTVTVYTESGISDGRFFAVIREGG